jgi:hypothetical protein
MEADPTGAEYIDGPNLYQALDSNPIALVDPAGTDPASTQPVIKDVSTSNGTFRITAMPFENAHGIVGTKAWAIFVAKKGTCPTCKSIRLVQSFRIRLRDGTYTAHDTTIADDIYRAIATKEDKNKGIEPGWIIDFNGTHATQGHFQSPYYTDNFPNPKADRVGDSDGKPTVQYDAPYLGLADGESFEAETVAFCEETGKELGAVKWGFTIPKGSNQIQLTPPTGADAGSTTFDSAKAAFDQYFNK